MNSSDIIVTIKSMKDIDSITDNTKYINLCIDSVDSSVIDYFLLNGKSYSYSECIDNRRGFIYANFDMFMKGEMLINKIINNMPSSCSEIEKVRYIYVSLGKLLSTDINVIENKNEKVSFDRISTINNIWGALSKGKVNDVVICKIFMYVCFRLGIKSELVSSNIKGNIANKVYVGNSILIVHIFNDICNIQGGFITKYFDKFNDDKNIDKKIGYIADDYMDAYIEKILRNIDYTSDNVIEDILNISNDIINIKDIGTYELSKIYRNIFDKYIPDYDIRINNLYINNGLDVKEHFTLFSYDNSYYSYNYSKSKFINLDYNILYDNIKNNRIGIYDEEDFELREKEVIL